VRNFKYDFSTVIVTYVSPIAKGQGTLVLVVNVAQTKGESHLSHKHGKPIFLPSLIA